MGVTRQGSHDFMEKTMAIGSNLARWSSEIFSSPSHASAEASPAFREQRGNTLRASLRNRGGITRPGSSPSVAQGIDATEASAQLAQAADAVQAAPVAQSEAVPAVSKDSESLASLSVEGTRCES